LTKRRRTKDQNTAGGPIRGEQWGSPQSKPQPAPNPEIAREKASNEVTTRKKEKGSRGERKPRTNLREEFKVGGGKGGGQKEVKGKYKFLRLREEGEEGQGKVLKTRKGKPPRQSNRPFPMTHVLAFLRKERPEHNRHYPDRRNGLDKKFQNGDSGGQKTGSRMQ